MHDCVVDQKLPYLYSHIYMCSIACMLEVQVCMYVAHVFQELGAKCTGHCLEFI